MIKLLHAETRTPVERWFLKRGTPHFIEGYAAGTHILTRLAPVLMLVFLVEVVSVSFGDRFNDEGQALAALGALGLTLALVGVINRARGRRALSRPVRVGRVEMALFLIVPALIALVFGTDPWAGALMLPVANALFLALAYTITSYGLLPMSLWGLGQVRAQLRTVMMLMIKTLPLLLLFSAFFFMSTEVWQIADNFPWPLYALALGALVALGALFIGFSIRTGVGELSQFDTWDDVCSVCADTPYEGADPRAFGGRPAAPPLHPRARFNVALVMFVSQSVQVLLVAAVSFAGLMMFGLLTIREQTVVTWLGDGELTDGDRLWSFDLFSHPVVLTRQLFVVAGFVAAFAGLQFAVSVVTDSNYRQEFAADMATQVRQLLAVRTLYLAPGE